MALIQLGGGVTDIRGSIAGNTFSKSKAGNIIRARRKPVNPRSNLQSTRRANTAYLATYWSKTLTAQQRADWRAYAAGTVWTNKLGQTIEIGGNAAFMRLNTLFLIAGFGVWAPAPSALGHAGGVTVTFQAENDTSKIQLDEPGGAFDKNDDGSHLLVFVGLPSAPGRDATPKGFRYVETLNGSAAAAPAFPYEMDAPYTMQEGQIITLRGMFTDADARVSGPTWASVAAVPSI